MGISNFQYRVLDRHLQLDAFIGLDSDETFLECMVSHGRDVDDCCLGFYYGTIDVIDKLVNNLLHTGQLHSLCQGKRVLFVRSVDCKKSNVDPHFELNACVNIFTKLRSALGADIFFYIAVSESMHPLLPDGMYYAHLNVKPNTPNNMFKRLMMSTIGHLLINQTKGSGLLSVKDSTYTAETIEIKENQSIDVPIGVETACKIWDKGVKFEMFCNLKPDSNILVVIGQSALDRKKTSLPAFRRWSWSREMPYSCIILNDPTLYLDDSLEGGWFLGNREHHYIISAANIIKKIAHAASIDNKNIVFMGASAGGFTSLMMAACIKGASACVDVPQTDLRSYCHRAPIDKLLSIAFGTSNTKDCFAEFNHRLSVLEFYKKIGNVPNIYYLQNSNDLSAGHVSSQFGEFVSGLAQIMTTDSSARKSKFIAETYDRSHLLRGGHFPLPKRLTLNYLEKAISIFCI